MGERSAGKGIQVKLYSELKTVQKSARPLLVAHSVFYNY